MNPRMYRTDHEALHLSRTEAGGKAWALAQMQGLGLAIPRWWLLPVAAWEAHAAATGLGPEIDATLAGLAGASAEQVEAAGRTLHARIRAVPPPLAWLAGLPAGPLAVRSSVADEDGARASFAGQMDSFLDQEGPEAVAAAVAACWASAFGPRALAYRRQQGLPLAGIRPAVILQEMVAAEAAGVLFTAHPQAGHRDRMRLAAVAGTGEKLVSGQAEAAEYDVDSATGRVLAGDSPLLRPDQIAVIAAAGRRLAAHFGGPQDIEWAWAGDTCYLLQCRPITQLPPPPYGPGSRRVWSNANIQESYCGVTTPLTYSFARRAYATVYRQTMRLMGIPARTIAAHEPVLENLLGLVQGRVYYHIDNWYRGLLLLPGFRRRKADMERMMGLTEPVDFIEDVNLPWGQRLRKLPGLLALGGRMLGRFARMDRMVAGFMAYFERAYASFDRAHLHELDLSALLAEVARAGRELLQRWETPIVNDFYVMIYNGRVARRLAAAGLPAELQNRLLAGEPGIESTAPTHMLMALASTVRADAGLRAAWAQQADGDLHRLLARDFPDFHARCLAYLDRYGDRCMGELKLESISLRQDPAFMYAMIRAYLPRPELDPARLGAQEQAMRQAAEAEARAALSPWGWWRLRRDLRRWRAGVRHRENMRLARTRVFGLYRDLYLEIGRQLAAAGVLAAPRQVFYLRVEELEDYGAGRAVSADLAALATVRAAEYARYAATEAPPPQFETRGPVYVHNTYAPPVTPEVPQGAQLQGTGCYPGVVEGRVRVVRDPAEARDLDGDILVAERTDPGWAPLFPACAGLLVARGSTLSHSAIVARELGIPAIVGIPGLLERLRTGDRVRLDGRTGTVTVLAD